MHFAIGLFYRVSNKLVLVFQILAFISDCILTNDKTLFFLFGLNIVKKPIGPLSDPSNMQGHMFTVFRRRAFIWRVFFGMGMKVDEKKQNVAWNKCMTRTSESKYYTYVIFSFEGRFANSTKKKLNQDGT